MQIMEHNVFASLGLYFPFEVSKCLIRFYSRFLQLHSIRGLGHDFEIFSAYMLRSISNHLSKRFTLLPMFKSLLDCSARVKLLSWEQSKGRTSKRSWIRIPPQVEVFGLRPFTQKPVVNHFRIAQKADLHQIKKVFHNIHIPIDGFHRYTLRHWKENKKKREENHPQPDSSDGMMFVRICFVIFCLCSAYVWTQGRVCDISQFSHPEINPEAYLEPPPNPSGGILEKIIF